MTPLLPGCRFGHGEAREMDIVYMLDHVEFPYRSVRTVLAVIFLELLIWMLILHMAFVRVDMIKFSFTQSANISGIHFASFDLQRMTDVSVGFASARCRAFICVRLLSTKAVSVEVS